MSEKDFQLGAVIRALRTQFGYSQSAFADIYGCARQYLNNVEAGRIGVSFSKMEQIGEKMGVDIYTYIVVARNLLPSKPGALRNASMLFMAQWRREYEAMALNRIMAERRKNAEATAAGLTRNGVKLGRPKGSKTKRVAGVEK